MKRVLIVLSLFGALSLHAESSYLRDHAKDAVHWQTWGDGTFAKARAEHKLIFLSIGYSGCHWCHVMQAESFTNGEIGELLNVRYVPILVDREEMPDVDATYIAFVQAMNDGSAGWPATLILTPDLSPLAGASYLKPDALKRALVSVAAEWAKDPSALLANGASALAAVRAAAQQSAPATAVSQGPVFALAERLRKSYDRENGGFGTAPKFLQPLLIDFVLRRESADRDIAYETLRKLARTTVHDQIGGGFHRYAVDAAWHTPHFEKMLGDQALMAIDYTEAWLLTKDDLDQRVARDTLDYALRELKLPNGLFAAGEGADSVTPLDGSPQLIEGVYYTWTEEELRKVTWKNADLAVYYFGIQKTGPNLIWPHVSDADAMKRFSLTKEQLQAKLADITKRMALVRSHRPEPKRDTNVVLGTNALMVSALARAGIAFGEDHYVYEAQKALRSLESAQPATADDYANLIQASLDVYEATYSTHWLERAIELQQKMDKLWNGQTLRYDSGIHNVPPALRELVPDRDGDLPAPNSVAAMNLLRIATLTGSVPARTKADAIFRSFAGQMDSSPTTLPALTSALLAGAAPAREVVILGNPANDDAKALLRVVRESFAPLRSLVVANTEAERAKLAGYIPLIAEMKPVGEKATAYVCVGTECKSPIVDAAKLAGVLSE
ncbi:MAG TPA: thioredoxin domain-containing protein [Thermoanaerobaculia bacterium]|nr:thioredoxin domain-containing protein [Thermoanaerobaculia bacterium]